MERVMDLKLEGKVIVITGSSRGIGRELIKQFAKEKSKIVINYFHSEHEAEELYKEILSINPHCIKVKADVTKMEEVLLLKNESISAFGKVDVLINNAGICADNNIGMLDEKQWNRVLDVNLTGVYLCCKVFSQTMANQKYGKIINISSLKGQEGCVGQSNYSVSKAGIIALSKTLAKELGLFNISVNAICPGFIVTDLNRHRIDKKAIAESRSLLSIENNLQDLVNFILYASSDKMVGVSGQVFNIDSRI